MHIIKSRKYLPLPIEESKLYLIEDDLKIQKEQLEEFLSTIDSMKSKDFSKKVLFGQEIKTNNTIEGYMDDLINVKKAITNQKSDLSPDEYNRILNLFYGYKYILQGEYINKDNLKKLYGILSKNLLDEEDIANMGEYYRNNPVYIFYSSNVSKAPDQGVDASLIDEYMNILLEYLNNSNEYSSMTDSFIKSQIAHFYFVYLHPYYDINGRTARTTAMWYLLNKKAYPYIIFNRAIQLNKAKYYTVIRDGRKYNNVTYFLNYMLKNTLIELEKEYTLEMIEDNSKYELTDADLQTIHYILSMNGILTYYDFMTFYNRLNPKKKINDIKNEILNPLIDKNIIIEGRKTNKGNNYIFGLNESLIEKVESNKHLSLEQKLI